MRDLTPPLLILCLLALTTGCQKQTVALDDLQSELEEIKAEASQTKKTVLALKHQFKALQESMEELDSALTADRQTIRETAKQGEIVVKEYASYRTKYRDAIQRRASGMQLADFKTDAGSYAGVRIRQLDSWQVAIQHQDGFAKIDLAELPDDLKKLLAYDPEIGPKPLGDAGTASSRVNVYVPTNPAVASSAPVAGMATGSVAQPMAEAPAEYSALPGKKTRAQEAQELYGDSCIITLWGKLSGSGGSSSGTPIKSPAASVPQGYKPIGSSYSGSTMDRLHKKNDRR